MLGAVLGLAGGVPGGAQPAPSAQVLTVLHTVDEHYNHLNSLRARFVEQYHGMGMSREEGGTLLLKKPGKMAWHYDVPVGKLFVFDGKFAWFYTPGDAQAQKIPAKQMDDLRTPLRFLLGHTRLEKELEGITVTPVGDQVRIAGVPRGMGQRVKLLTLRVTPAGAITHMELEEIDGAKTEFEFSQMQENVPTSNAEFTFIAPAGVTVVNGASPI
jgi:outer membrane lipoprotein carrier protein